MPRRTSTTDPSPHLPYAQSARDGLTLSQVVPILRRGWAWILIPTLLVAAGAVAFVQVVPPRYTAEAKILLESRDPSFARTATERGDQALPIDEQAVASQVQVVMSRDLAREAVRRLNLVGNPEFDPTVGEAGPIRRILAMAGLGKTAPDAKPEDRVLDTYFERLLVYPAGKSRILQVEFRAGDPELAAKSANTISELYIASLEAAKVDTARYASTWLGTNIDTLRARVADAEAKVEAYRVKSGLIGSGTAGSSLGGQQLGELSSQLSQARTIKADLTGRVKILKEMIKEGRAFEIPDVANNDLIRRTVESRMTLRAQLALESRTLLPAHPRIKELTAQVDDLETQIKAAAERIVRTLENDAKIAGARVDSVQAAVQGQSDVVFKGNSSEIQLRALEREAKVQREQLESYLSRFREASARDAESATPADARIVSRAMVPELPSFPKKIPVIGFATALAFTLAAAAVLGRHLLATPDSLDRRATAGRSEPGSSGPVEPRAECIDYPEPMPPEQQRFATSYAGFGSVVTANASFPRLVTEGGSPFIPAAAQAAPKAESSPPSARQDDRYALQALIERLGTVAGQGGRCVLVVETAENASAVDGLAAGLARTLAARAPTLSVDVSGKATDRSDPGLTDLVAGEAAFLDVIHPVAGSRHHVVRTGFTTRSVLLDEPHGLAIGLNAMAQAYDWVICRLAVAGEPADDLLTALSACMDSVVIVSDAAPDDAELVALYGAASEAGAGQVLVARDPAVEPEMQLRLSA